MNKLSLLLLLSMLLTACTPEGYPSTDTEAIVVGVVLLGVMVLFGWYFHCLTRNR
jgi:hypothetical protein